MKRIRLLDVAWPEADRAAFDALFKKGHPLDEAGPLSKYRSPSINGLEISYGHWLTFILEHLPDFMSEAPADRITAERLVAFAESRPRLAPGTICKRLKDMGTILRAMDPDRPNDREKAVINQAAARARDHRSPRKDGRIVDTQELFEAGLKHFWDHLDAGVTQRNARIQCRNGLMMALLSLMPMRRRPFVNLELGRTLLETSTGWHVRLTEADLKCGNGWESAVPDALVEALSIYIAQVHPLLAQGLILPTNRLWLTWEGKPMTEVPAGALMKGLVQRLIGRDISFNLFRDCAVTTLAIRSPQHARQIKSLLGHTTDRTATHYYNQANGLDAGRVLARHIDAIKRKG